MKYVSELKVESIAKESYAINSKQFKGVNTEAIFQKFFIKFIANNKMYRTKYFKTAWLIVPFISLLVLPIEGLSDKINTKANVSTIGPIGVNNNCSISSLDICLSIIKEVAIDPNLAFPITKEDLRQACWKLKEGDTCADNHMKNCTNKNQKMLFQDIVKGTKKVLDSLCVQGDFQNSYLRYAKCFKNISMSEKKCATIIRKVQNMDLDPQITSDMEGQLKRFCCTMKESVDCQIDFVRRDCGDRAVIFFDRYLREISSQLMVDHCATYTYSDRCVNRPKLDSLSNSVLNNNYLDGFFKLNVILISLSHFI